jgi:hypothetical protein
MADSSQIATEFQPQSEIILNCYYAKISQDAGAKKEGC